MRSQAVFYHLRRLFNASSTAGGSDRELLEQFSEARDENAFRLLMERHGPLVLQVCRRMVRDEHLAEEVFQATFLVLARSVASIRNPDALAGWLHGVATRLALKARKQEATQQRLRQEQAQKLGVEPPAADGLDDMTLRELRSILDEELLQLPEKHRLPLLLCYLEGKTRDEAAQILGCPLETLKSRLERGRELLQARLSKRKLSLATTLAALLLTASEASALPAVRLVRSTTEAAVAFAAGTGSTTGGAAGLAQNFLAQGLLTPLRYSKLPLAAAGLLVVLGLSAPAFLAFRPGSTEQPAPEPPSAGVFEGPPAPHAPRLRADLPATGGPLRKLIVEERVGAKRTRELVRVPLFFHEGECTDPHGLLLTVADREGQPAIPYQPDDIRRAPDGSVSRMHLYFPVDLLPWERQQFWLMTGENPGKQLPSMTLRPENGRVTLAGDDLQLTFWSEGNRAGAIAAMKTAVGKVTLPDEMLAPRVTLQRQSADLQVLHQNALTFGDTANEEVRDLRYGAGPLFAKLMVRRGPRSAPDSAEFTYLVPRTGNHFLQTERLISENGSGEPETGDVVGATSNALLAGQILLGETTDDQRIVPVPAGLRKLTRSIHGRTLSALVNPRSGIGLMSIPSVFSDGKTIDRNASGEVTFAGPAEWQRTPGAKSEDLRSFWNQTRFQFTRSTTEESLWEASRPAWQPLTAIVEEPGAATQDLHERLKLLMKQFPATHSRNWMQEAGRLYTLDDPAGMKKLLAGTEGKHLESALDYWLGGARKARETQLKDGGEILESHKGRASGPLDPWNITFGASPMVSLAARVELSESLDRICLAIGQAQREFNGRTDSNGCPTIDTFYGVLNMQVGSIHAGLYGARKFGDGDLLQFYRDTARNPRNLDLVGHGQRVVNSSMPRDANSSEQVMQSNADLFLRAVELACNEDLWLHPAIFGRYTDCIDVNADLCHRTLVPSRRPPSSYRANYFRLQSHDRGWESWGGAPYLALLGRAEDRGSVGLTEACYFSQQQIGGWINWPEITTFFHVDLALRDGLRRYHPPASPALPANVQTQRQADGNRVRWQPVAQPDLLGYRIYRADRTGGPWTLLNSPYGETPRPLLTGTECLDVQGKPGQVYFVTAVNEGRQESRWFAEEPLPK